LKHLSLDEQHQRYLDQAGWTKTIREYLFSRASFQTQNAVVEVGSGTGAILQSLLEEGDFTLTGVDINRSALHYAKKNEKTFRLIQATGNQLPFSDSCFDISYCHYLLLWVSHPMRILSEMRRVTRPGGCVIALAEPDHQSRIDYPPPLDRLGEHQTQALQAQGADTSMGRKLSTLFHQVGLKDIEVGILGALWKTKGDHPAENSEWMTLQADIEEKLSADNLLEYQHINKSAWANGRRILFVPTFYAVGVVE